MKLEEKIEKSIALIKRAEKLAMKMQPEMGFHVGFSGGKDSQCVLELVKMAGVRYHVVYNVTTIDLADNVRFIKEHYPEVQFSVPEKSFMKLVEKKGLPTMGKRWCCAVYKEKAGAGSVVLTGIRKEESLKRAEYKPVTKWAKRKESRKVMNLDEMEDNEFRCVGGRDKIMVYPLLEWTEKDVWEFHKLRNIPLNPCYVTYQRVGCIFCPFARARDIRKYCVSHPKLKKVLISALDEYRRKKEGRRELLSADDYFEWWLTHESLSKFIAKKRQLKMSFND